MNGNADADIEQVEPEPHFRSGSLPDLVAVGIFLFDLGVFDTAQSEGNGVAHVREDINRQTRVEPERQFQVVAERASEGAFGFVGKPELPVFIERSTSPKSPKCPLLSNPA